MVFNPIFVSRAGAEDFQEAGKQSKIASANYMFSDIIKVYLNDAPETASGLTLTGITDKAAAVTGEAVETATITGEEKESDAASALILSGESLQTAKLPAMQLVEFANAFLPVEAAKLNTLESVTTSSATTTASSVIKSDVQESISIQNYLPSEFNSTASVNTASVTLMTMANPAGKADTASATAATVNAVQSAATPIKSSLEEKALQDLHAAFSELMQTAVTEGKQTKAAVSETVNTTVAQKPNGIISSANTASEALPVLDIENSAAEIVSQVKAASAPVAEAKVSTTPAAVSAKQTVTTEQIAKELGLNQVKYTPAATNSATSAKQAETTVQTPEVSVSGSVTVDKTTAPKTAGNTVPLEVKSESAPTVIKVAETVNVKNIAKETKTTTSTQTQSNVVKNSGTVVVEQNSTVIDTKAEAGKTVTPAMPTEAKDTVTVPASTIRSAVKPGTTQAQPEVNNAAVKTDAVKTAEVNMSGEKQVAEKPLAKNNTASSEKVIEIKNSKPADTKQSVRVELNTEQTKTAAPAETIKTAVKEVYRSQPHVVKSDTPIKGIKMQTQNTANAKPEITTQNTVVEKTVTGNKPASSTPVTTEAEVKTIFDNSTKSATVTSEKATVIAQATKTESTKPVQNEKAASQPVTVKTEKPIIAEQKVEVAHTDIPKASAAATEGKESKKLETPVVNVKQPNVTQSTKSEAKEVVQTQVVADDVAIVPEDKVAAVAPKVVDKVYAEPATIKVTIQKEMPEAEIQKTVTTTKEAAKQDVTVKEESKIQVSTTAKTTEGKELKDTVVAKNEVELVSTGNESVKQAATFSAPKTESGKSEKVKVEQEVKPLAAEHAEKATAPVKKESSDFTEQQKSEKETVSTVTANSKPEKEQKQFVVDRPVAEKKEVTEQDTVNAKAGVEYQRPTTEDLKAIPTEESTKATETESPAIVKEVATSVDNRVRESVHNVTTKPANEFEAPQAAPKLVKVSDAMKEVQTIIEARQKETMVFQLDPENMGKMKVTLTNVENILRAHIEVETESARKTLEGNMQQLLQKLESNGVQVQSVQITMQHQDQQKRQPHYSNKKQQQSYPEDQNATDHEDSVRELGYNTVEYVV